MFVQQGRCRAGYPYESPKTLYKDRLRDRHGLQVLVPESRDREVIHRVIYEELCLGKVLAASRSEFRRVIGELVARGAEAIILGCTEISLLVADEDSPVALFDTTGIHARSAAELALS